jgi:Putative hemolysin
VRLAKNEEEVFQAQKLRYEVFVREFGAKVSVSNDELKLDRDPFDQFCKHLILVDKECFNENSKVPVVGTIRLLEANVAKNNLGFYSAGEYNLNSIYEMKKRSLEIGRACVHKKYRKNIALLMLWKGLGKFVIKRNIKVLFGVASFHGIDASKFSSALSLLYHRYRAPNELNFKAHRNGYLNMNIIPEHEIELGQAMSQMPNLIKAYIRLGGKVAEGGFVDNIFNTIDIGIIIDTDKMTSKYREFYERGTRNQKNGKLQ